MLLGGKGGEKVNPIKNETQLWNDIVSFREIIGRAKEGGKWDKEPKKLHYFIPLILSIQVIARAFPSTGFPKPPKQKALTSIPSMYFPLECTKRGSWGIACTGTLLITCI